MCSASRSTSSRSCSLARSSPTSQRCLWPHGETRGVRLSRASHSAQADHAKRPGRAHSSPHAIGDVWRPRQRPGRGSGGVLAGRATRAVRESPRTSWRQSLSLPARLHQAPYRRPPSRPLDLELGSLAAAKGITSRRRPVGGEAPEEHAPQEAHQPYDQPVHRLRLRSRLLSHRNQDACHEPFGPLRQRYILISDHDHGLLRRGLAQLLGEIERLRGQCSPPGRTVWF